MHPGFQSQVAQDGSGRAFGDKEVLVHTSPHPLQGKTSSPSPSTGLSKYSSTIAAMLLGRAKPGGKRMLRLEENRGRSAGTHLEGGRRWRGRVKQKSGSNEQIGAAELPRAMIVNCSDG